MTVMLSGLAEMTLIKKDPVFRNQVLEKTSPYLLLGAQDQRLGAGQEQLPCSGNYQGTETRMVRACHTPSQPLQNHSSGNPGGWATP